MNNTSVNYTNFSINTKHGLFNNCHIVATRYAMTKNLRLNIKVDLDNVMSITTNTGYILDDSEIAVKNYSENEGIESSLRALNIIKDHTKDIKLHEKSIPVYSLTDNFKSYLKNFYL